MHEIMYIYMKNKSACTDHMYQYNSNRFRQKKENTDEIALSDLFCN